MEFKLSDLCIGGKGSYGIGASAVPYDPNKYTYLRITDINEDGSLNFADLKSVDDEDSYKYLLQENDIVFARTGNSTGKTYFYQKEHGCFVYAGFLIKFSLDATKVNPRILKYYTHSKEYFDWVHSFDTGGTRGNINAKTFGDMVIDLPERSVQDRIVAILSSLDAKIENNNKINANLEAQAQALFKSWFIDFEPFQNGEFEDSELGRIPKGWKVYSLEEIAFFDKNSINPGKTPDELFSHYSLPAFDEKKLPEKQFGKEILSNKFTISNNTVLLSKLNPRIKRIWYVEEVEENAICSTEFIPFKAKDNNLTAFLYCYLNSQLFYDNALGMVNGATGSHQRFDVKYLLTFKFAASEESMLKFSSATKPLLSQIFKNIQETKSLSTLRDTLLPKLMSGEIEV